MILSEEDIHNHLLPGVDDGFKAADDSFEAIAKIVEAGVTSLVFTPHVNPDVYPDTSEEDLRKVYESFAPEVQKRFGIRTHLAAEYMVVNGFDKRLADPSQEFLTYEDGSILIEMSYYFRSRNLESAVFEANMRGMSPILAHPERYLYMADSLSDFDKLRESGVRFQSNLMSFTGAYGPQSIKILRYLLKKGYVDFCATDLHSSHQLSLLLSRKPFWKLRLLGLKDGSYFLRK